MFLIWVGVKCKKATTFTYIRKYAPYFDTSIYYVVPFFVHFTPTLFEIVHELMHSFGAKHDPDPTSEPECTPQDKVRKLRQIKRLHNHPRILRNLLQFISSKRFINGQQNLQYERNARGHGLCTCTFF